jgi:hypothetical protein
MHIKNQPHTLHKLYLQKLELDISIRDSPRQSHHAIEPP